MDIGAGVTQEPDYSPQFLFADAIKSSTAGWYICEAASPNSPGSIPGASPPLDPFGYPIGLGGLKPGQALSCWTYVNAQGPPPVGDYRLSWEGTGSVVVQNVNAQGPRTFTSSPAAVPITTIGNALIIAIAASDPADHVRGVEFLVPGARPGELFNPAFLALASPFSILRVGGLMGLQSGDQNVGATAAAVPPSRARTQAGPAGVNFEHLAALAAGRSLWINVPVGAEPAYVETLARVLVPAVKPPRKLYIEFGNECWNTAYARQYQYLCGRMPHGATGWGAYDATTAGLAADVWNVFRAIDASGVVVRVVANQWSDPSRLAAECAYLAAHAAADDPNKGFDVLSGAPYVAVDTTAYDATTTTSAIIADWRTQLATTTRRQLDAWLAVAARISARVGRDVPTYCYETGFGVTAVNAQVPWYKAMLACQTDPAMAALTFDYLQMFAAAGIAGMNWSALVTAPTMYGQWGLTSYTGQPLAQSPKLEAVLKFIGLGAEAEAARARP